MGKPQSPLGCRGRRFMEVVRGLDPERVLVVPVDAAKFSSKAAICNYYGDVIADPFSFSMDELGMAELLMQIRRAEQQVDALSVFAAIEATGHYYETVVRMLEEQGYPVTVLNAYTTSEERKSGLNWSKTDEIDLGIIGQSLINSKGTEFRLRDGLLREMLTVSRGRRREQRQESRLKIEIRALVDRIWLELQGFYLTGDASGERITVFSDFWCKSCRWVLYNYPDPGEVLKLGAKGIRQRSRAEGIRWRAEGLKKLMLAAKRAIKRPSEETEAERAYLKLKLDQLAAIESTVEFLEHQLEGLLVQTPAVLLLSIKGIGVVTASEFYAEAEGVVPYKSAGALIKKAGTNPLVSQSGDRKAHYGKISKQGNPALRYVLGLIGKNLTINPYFESFASRLRDRGLEPKQVHIAVGNKFVHVARAMIRDGVTFAPPTWQGPPIGRPILEQVTDEEHRRIAGQTLARLNSLWQQTA